MELPKSLDGTYDSILKNINQGTRAYARRLLQCLTVAARPLRVEELAEVLAFDFDEAPGGIPTLNADWRREDQERAVLSTCSSLITVIHDGKSRVVQFSHFSVKEFLTSDRLANATEDISFYHIAPAPAHTILTQACLSILLRLDDIARKTSMRQFPLLEYTLEHWVDHALFENVSLRVQDGIEILFDVEKPHFSRWVRIDSHIDDYYHWQDEKHPDQLKAAPMYYAALCGFTQVIEKLITVHPEYVSATGGALGTALHTASDRNHLKVVQSLLRHGADVNAPGLWGRTPLLFATEKGHLEVVRWLLEHGAEVNAEDEDDNRTSLHLAALNGRFEIGRVLFKHNANTTARDKYGRTPLHLACSGGHVEMVRCLLNHGANPGARDNNLRMSLHDVSYTGNLDIARLLVEHGAEVDAEDMNGITSYQFALKKGHDEVVQFLLAHGAERT